MSAITASDGCLVTYFLCMQSQLPDQNFHYTVMKSLCATKTWVYTDPDFTITLDDATGTC